MHVSRYRRARAYDDFCLFSGMVLLSRRFAQHREHFFIDRHSMSATHSSFFVLIHICRPRAQIGFCTILTQIATDPRARYAPLLWFSFLLCGPRSTCSGRRFSQMTGARSYTRYSWKTACSLSLASIIRSIHSRSPGARHHQPAPSISNSFGSASQRRACARFSMTVDAPGRGDDRCCFGLIPLLCQIALMRGMRVVKGSDDGWHGSQLLFKYRKVS